MRKHQTSFTENKRILLALSATRLLDYFQICKRIIYDLWNSGNSLSYYFP